MANEEQQEYRATGTEFKHEDTTQVMRIRFIAGNRFPIYPTEGHKFVAKVGDADGNYTGDYPVSVSGSSFEVKSSDLVGLGSGSYRLEIWESYIDSEGNTQTGIFPSPRTFVSFIINKNIEDTAWDLVKDISFQDLVNTAVTAAGQNIVAIATNTLPAGSQASVTQKYEDGKNKFTFNIPQGLKGDKGDTGPQGPEGDRGDTGPANIRLSEADTRNDNNPPSWYIAQYPQSIVTEFKDTSNINVGAILSGMYCNLTTIVPWSDSSGTLPVQIATNNTNAGCFAYRVATSADSWGAWQQMGAQGPQGSRGYSFWAMKATAGGNVSGRNITDLYNASASNLPEVNDLVVQPDGNVYQVTGIDAGGGTFNLGSALFSINDQAEYQELNDKVQNSGGGVNLATNTGNVSLSEANGVNCPVGCDIGDISVDTLNELRGKAITISVDVEWNGWQNDSKFPNDRLGWEIALSYKDGSPADYYGAWLRPTTANGKQRIYGTYMVPDKEISSLGEGWAYIQISCTSAKISHLKIERGSVSTPWTPAPEDTITAIQALQQRVTQLEQKINPSTQPASSASQSTQSAASPATR